MHLPCFPAYAQIRTVDSRRALGGRWPAAALLLTLAFTLAGMKRQTIVIPKIEFHEVTITEAVRFLRAKSVELDVSETDPQKRGVNIVLNLRTVPGSPAGPAAAGAIDSEKARISQGADTTLLG